MAKGANVGVGRLPWGHTRGQLVVIGGLDIHGGGGETILSRFVELAGGAKARIVVIATASPKPEPVEQEYVTEFIRLGATHVDAVRVHTRADANDEVTAAAVEGCSGVFFTGGDQLRIATIVGGSRLDSVLHTQVERGAMVLAGASAGAAMMTGTTVMDGRGVGVSTTSVRIGPGMEFLKSVLIDMHFAERGQLNRLLSAIALYPHELGLGIDHNTAIVVSDGRFEVIGSGSVTVLDAGQAAMIRTPARGDGPIALSDVRMHVLPAGYAFELTGRRPVVVSPPADVQDWGMAG
jgi:cyanophycinase